MKKTGLLLMLLMGGMGCAINKGTIVSKRLITGSGTYSVSCSGTGAAANCSVRERGSCWQLSVDSGSGIHRICTSSYQWMLLDVGDEWVRMYTKEWDERIIKCDPIDVILDGRPAVEAFCSARREK